MFTKNWYRSLAAYAMAPTTKDITSINQTTYDGVSRTLATTKYGEPAFGGAATNNCAGTVKTVLKSQASGSSGVVFGDGNTPPSIDDYCLSGNVFSNLSSSASSTLTQDDSGFILKTVYSLTNLSDSTFTVSEIGLFNHCVIVGSYRNVLIERTVLDTPVPIPAGGVGQVTYTIRMNYPV